MQVQIDQRSKSQYAYGALKNILYDLQATFWWAGLPSTHVVCSAPASRTYVRSRPKKSHKINGMEAGLALIFNVAECHECASTMRLLYQPTVLHLRLR